MVEPNVSISHATILAVTGMTCGGCASTVQRVLTRVPGVVQARVDHQSGRAVVEGDAPPAALVAAVQAAGFGASTSTNGDA